jgi:hypothetical protein
MSQENVEIVRSISVAFAQRDGARATHALSAPGVR